MMGSDYATATGITDHADLLDLYEALLHEPHPGSDEVPLPSAYQLGRELLGMGVGVLDLADVHRRVILQLLNEQPVDVNARIDRSTQLFMESLGPYVGAAPTLSRAESILRQENQRLEERARRIAHALHDEAGQLLASLHVAIAQMTGDFPREGQKRVAYLRRLLDQVEDQIRRLAYELRPLILDDLGLLAACEFLAEGASRRTGVSVIVRGSAGDRLPQDIETAVYRVVQEALTNATRHARAQLVMIDFERRQRTLAGEIRDDGIGFDTRRLLSGPSKSLGLSGICERLSAVGGRASIDSNPGGGTRIRFEVPLEA